ncbi:hypothetical protein F5X99DRAFT_425981 [Biscogniauxia marginata]|nr:hypothetical protein F5X99DRAFT_425981 [Biscogniauxia marginata]
MVSRNLALPMLPIEILVMAFSLLPHTRDVHSVMLSCKRLHEVVSGFEADISFNILQREFDPERLPMAVARYAAETAPWKQPMKRKEFTQDIAATYEEKIVAFCERYLRRRRDSEVTLKRCDSTLAMAHGIFSFHVPVARMSRFFGNSIDDDDAYFAGRDAISNEQQVEAMTPTELMRVEKAFYIIDIIHNLFILRPKTRGGQDRPESGDHDTAFTKFWQYFSPWENRQVEVITSWIAISMKTVFKGIYFRRMVYREDFFPQDRRIEVLLLLGVAAMDAIVVRGKFKPQGYKRAIDGSCIDLCRHQYRCRTSTYDRIYFDQEAVKGTSDALLKDCDYQKYDTDQDPGPRDAWLYGLYWRRHTGVLGGQLRQRLSRDPMGYAKLKLAVFWDRERLSRNFGALFPTHEEMVEAAKSDSHFIPLIR